MLAERRNQQARLHLGVALPHQISQVRPVKAGNVLIRLAQAQLLQNVVADAARGAGRERGDGLIRKIFAQRAELPVLRTEFVAPFGDAMRFVDGKKCNGRPREPRYRVLARQPLRR